MTNESLKFKRQPLRLDAFGQRAAGYQPPWRRTPRPNKTAANAAARLQDSIQGRVCRPASGMEDWYLATECGKIISLRSGKILGGHPVRGYHAMRFSTPSGRRPRYFHAVIAETFLGPKPTPKSHVNHKDGNKLNNAVVNLEWVSPRDNVRHAYATGLMPVGEQCSWAKVTEAQVRQIRALSASMRQCDVARITGVKPGAVHKIAKRLQWRHIV